MTASTTATQQGLGAALRKLHRTYIRRLQAQLAEHGVSVAQYLHLRALWEEAGLTQNEVSARLGIEKASSTSVLEALERDGLINRVRDGQDRRKVRIYLSDAGENLRGTIMPSARKVATQASYGLTEAELDAFFRTIDRMLANLTMDLIPCVLPAVSAASAAGAADQQVTANEGQGQDDLPPSGWTPLIRS